MATMRTVETIAETFFKEGINQPITIKITIGEISQSGGEPTLPGLFSAVLIALSPAETEPLEIGIPGGIKNCVG